MIMDTQGCAVLPVRQQRGMYVAYASKFRSDVAVGAEAELDGQPEDEAPFEGVSQASYSVEACSTLYEDASLIVLK